MPPLPTWCHGAYGWRCVVRYREHIGVDAKARVAILLLIIAAILLLIIAAILFLVTAAVLSIPPVSIQ
jgi:hypothetical protein